MSDKSITGTARCFFCLEPSMVLLDRRLRNSLPHDCGVIDMTPCHKCEKFMQKHVILITIDGATMPEVQRALAEYQDEWNRTPVQARKHLRQFIPNPVRMGGWIVAKENVVSKICPDPKMAEDILKKRWAFIDHNDAQKMGLLDQTVCSHKTVEDALAAV